MTYIKHSTMFKKKYLIILALTFGILNSVDVEAQTSSASNVMAKIYRAYDSIPYVTFDVKYTYNSDTLNGNFTHDVLAGEYTLAGKHAKFRLGDIEFMQNDSFLITVYNKEKFMLVADPPKTKTLPMRETIDSLLQVYSLHYNITTTLDSTNGSVNFVGNDSIAQFKSLTINYEPQRKLLKSVNYVFQEMEANDSSQSVPTLRTKRLKVEFSNYRVDNFSKSLYDENNYVFFEKHACKPVSKYKEYRVFYYRKTPR
jgi:hypothetical protein